MAESRDASSVARFRSAYVRERERLIARRLPFAARVFLLSIGVSAVVEAAAEPGRTLLVLGVFLSQVVCCVGATVLVRSDRPALRPSHAAALVSTVIIALAVLYLVRAGAAPDRIGLSTACLLAGASLLIPWGGGVQALVSGAVAVILIGVAPGILEADQFTAVWLPVTVVAALAYAGARHVDLYREDAFVRAMLESEEARATAALARVGETLHVHLRQPDLLDRVCHVAREELRCDWTALYLLDEAVGGHRLRGFAGPAGADSREALAEYVASEETLPLLHELPASDVVEIRDGRRQTMIPEALVERFRIGAALFTPIRRDGRLIGAIAYGFIAPSHEFSAPHRRLVIGIAHVMSVAVENLRLIDQLAAASRLKSEFVATMSHELRTPLSVIGGYADLLDEGAFGPVTAEQHDTLARIRQSSVALLELVNMTLDLGRLESGREEVSPTVFAVHELAEEIQGEQQALVPADVRHMWEYDYDLAVQTDRTKVKTILKNLVGNALKFTTAGRVDVRIVWYDGELRLDVEDTGVGIDAEHLPVIFEMFRQVDASSTRRFEGVGLGLHIVQRLTTLLGGVVTVESTPGDGSRFRVRIPSERATVGARHSA